MYTLPQDAPDRLRALLAQWHDIAKDHKPTKWDLSFDALLSDHPGLFWVERTDESPHDFDLRLIKAGPEVIRRNKPGILEKKYSELLGENAFSYVPEIFGGCLSDGQPHYWDILSAEYGERATQYQRLLLPLFDDQGVAVSLLGSAVYSGEVAANNE